MLLVDDNPAKLLALETVLAPLELNFVRAHSGREALRCILKENFALILLDVQMQEMDGFETASLIRMRKSTEDTPIIFITAFEKAEIDMQRGYTLGAVDYIFLPIVPEVLRAKVSVFVDLYRKAEEVTRLLVDAQDASRAKSEFLNMAAHELRTPLSVVVGYLSMLEDGTFGEVPQVWRKPLEILNGKAEELNGLVSDLLIAARLEAGRLPTEVARIDLRDAVAAAVRRGDPLAVLAGGQIVCELPAEPVPVLVDPDHLAKILDNLIKNALTYTSAPPDVRVSVGDEDPPRVAVEDRGLGIEPDLWERIFERFFRINDPALGGQAGTGLGLYISRELAVSLSGSLELERSRPGEGSVFALTLPPAPAAAPAPNGLPHPVTALLPG